jgi:hypothetical protein
MRKLIAAFALTAAALNAAPSFAEDDAPSLVTIVATAEPQTQLMAMVLTMQAMRRGAAASILLCGPGGDLALKDAPATATTGQKPADMSPQGLMGKLMEEGAAVEVCALYLPNKGAGPEALLDGVGVAKPPEIAAKMLGENTRLLTF